MRTGKMLAVLLAGLITLSLAGCGADKAENTSSDPATTESGITATVTESTAEPTAESSLPAERKARPNLRQKKKRLKALPLPTAAERQIPPSLRKPSCRLYRRSRQNRRRSQNRRKASLTKLRSLLILHQPKLQNRSLPVHSLILTIGLNSQENMLKT